jgi:hypothetical protein
MIYTTLDNFYLDADKLHDSPSRAHGVSEEVEIEQRIYGCELIQEACILLSLPQVGKRCTWLVFGWLIGHAAALALGTAAGRRVHVASLHSPQPASAGSAARVHMSSVQLTRCSL